MKRMALGVLAYIMPTFALGFVWHLMLFKHSYEVLAIYRSDIIILFGFLSMLIQAVIFTGIYRNAIEPIPGKRCSQMLAYGTLGAVLSWSFTTLAVAAKNVMTSVPDYLLIETAYTLVRWAMVAPLTVFAFVWSSRSEASSLA